MPGEVRRAQLDQARQEAGQRLAAAGRRDQKRGTAAMRLRQKFELMRPRVQPRLANQFVNSSGRSGGLRSSKFHLGSLVHDPEKWEPVFRKDHVQTTS